MNNIYGVNIYLKKNIINIVLTIDTTLNGSLTLKEARDMINHYNHFFKKFKDKKININKKLI